MSSSIVKSLNAPSTSLAYGSVLLAAALWGGSIVAQKMALGSFSAVEASVLRDIGGLAILLTTWWWQEGTLAKLTKADLRLLGFLGSVCWATISLFSWGSIM